MPPADVRCKKGGGNNVFWSETVSQCREAGSILPSKFTIVPPQCTSPPIPLSYTLPVTRALEKLRDLFFCFSFLGSCNVRGEFVPPRAKEHRFKLGGLDQFNSITKQLTIKTKKVAQFIPFVAKLTQRQSHVWKQLREWAIQRRTGQFWLLWRRRG